MTRASTIALSFLVVVAALPVAAQGSFVNWEHPHVHPLDRTPDGTQLLAVNTPDNRLEVFEVADDGGLAWTMSIPVGLDPVTVRVRNDDEAWVVNHVSDSIGIVDLIAGNVVRTIHTDDEPADVVFAGDPERAFVSCSQVNRVLVFDLDDLGAAPEVVEIFGEDPRAMAVSDDGSEVYVAIFESGNGTTVLNGNILTDGGEGFPPDVVSESDGPYGGENPPPNDGDGFFPEENPDNDDPLGQSLIVRKNEDGDWLDVNGEDWTAFVSGDDAELSGRPVGWDLPDYDVAIIDAETLDLSYIPRLMNMCMAIAVNPDDGKVIVVGTEATNEVRFEPNITGTFIRVNAAIADPAGVDADEILDLNPHLDYVESTLESSERADSIGDPRAVVWNAAGDLFYVAGKGSNNVVVMDTDGERATDAATIEVGEGPTGLVLDEDSDLLYVLNHFDGSISIVDTAEEDEIERVAFFDPTPLAVQVGRKHLYDTHQNSGLGHIACASCHIDARQDRLAWDLGDPGGETADFDQNCIDDDLAILGTADCSDFHPMKGPMLTQTLRDIIGKEPFHWRGDRAGIEEFNGAFIGLQGDDENLTDEEMQEFEDFLATIHFPPNPFRELDNSLPTDLPLTGHFTTGDFGPAGDPLPTGDAVEGLELYRTGNLVAGALECVTCHTLPTGAGRDSEVMVVFRPVPPFVFFELEEIPVGENGEHHLAVTSLDLSSGIPMKVPHLRNLYERVGMDFTQVENLSGFGYIHDGTVDTLARFVAEPVFTPASDQEVADLVAFLLAFSGGDLPEGGADDVIEPLGPESQDTHAAVGQQITFDGLNNEDDVLLDLLADFLDMADEGAVAVVAKGVVDGELRGYHYDGSDTFQSDRADETIESDALVDLAAAGGEITFTVVVAGTEVRIGVDRDEDGFFDGDELDACSDPADATIVPGEGCDPDPFVRGDCDGDGTYGLADPIRLLETMFSDGEPFPCDDACDGNDNGALSIIDALVFLEDLFIDGDDPPAPFEECGRDSTADDLTCDTGPVCP